MDIAAYSIQNKVITFSIMLVLLLGGYASFNQMGRLEDPEFTIKEALVITPYRGASALEVEEEVTDVIERAIQEMGQLEQVTSTSKRDRSTVKVQIKDRFDKTGLPQVWDELRRKIADIQHQLPPGSGPSKVVDDYGEVYGVFLVVTGDGYSYAELKNYVDLLKRELSLVDGVGKVTTYGERTEAIYIEFSHEQMSQLGISSEAIVQELNQRNAIVDAGSIQVGENYTAFALRSGLDNINEIRHLLIRGMKDRQFYLKDIARVYRGYVEPQDKMIRFNQREGIGIGISTVSGGNVVVMGAALNERLRALEPDRPIGIEIGVVSLQSKAVTAAIDGFVMSLLQAMVIVVLVLLVFMGLRSGLIIGFILLITISGSFIFLKPMDVALERISLGALIIALGMLVDNAIVVIDGMLVRIAQGMPKEQAASDIVKQSKWPLLGATLIAVLAFAAIGTSEDSTGEFCRSLFQVVCVSLLLSWFTAITIAPLLGVVFLQTPKASHEAQEPFNSGIYLAYKQGLKACLKHRFACIAVTLGIFAISLWGFQKVDHSFFPSSTRAQFMVDLWMPEGTHIDSTLKTVKRMEALTRKEAGVTQVTSVVGEGAPRFILTYAPEMPNPSFAQLLVDVDSNEPIEKLMLKVEQRIHRVLPTIQANAYLFEMGPGGKGKVEARFVGTDPKVLRQLAQQADAILAKAEDARAIRNSWRNKVQLIRPVIAEEQANINGISRAMIAGVLHQSFDGQQVGIFREHDLLIPIVVRSDNPRNNLQHIENLYIWSPVAQKRVPLRQFIQRYDVDFEDRIIKRQDRKRSISVYADPKQGYASELLDSVRPEIEAIPLPPGYSLEWGGEFEDTNKAQGGLMTSIPFFVGCMILITICLFNSIKQPLIIWLCVPLATIGVTVGLLAFNQSFGFLSLLGFLSLSGMLIKNAIVLIEEINAEWLSGRDLFDAIVHSGVSRLRPVSMAALTTALGMIPLIFDAFFASMAVTIIGGLMVATVLTLFVVPVLYSLFYREWNLVQVK